MVLLLWPAGTPARGPQFWLCVVGIPNAVFFAALAIARTIYEADTLHARFRNRHRAVWLRGRIVTAQRPLQVLGAGYCLPLGGKLLGEVLKERTSFLQARVPRSGTGRVLHNRFADDDPILHEDSNVPGLADGEPSEDIDAGHGEAPHPFTPVPPAVRVIAHALASVADSVRALSQYGPEYAPAVRVLSAPETADERVEQVKQALQRAGLPDLECIAVPATDGLLVADAWLDAGEQRPLLVVAAQWHDVLTAGSTEGGVAVLLGLGAFQLPETIRVLGLLHRPVADQLEGLEAVLANSVLWGKTDAASVTAAWITGLDGSHDTNLLAAMRGAGLAGVAKQETQRRPDPLAGHAGAAGGWLSVAAAMEGAGGTQLILHTPSSTSIVQAAILHVNGPMKQEEPDDERSQ
ncbi:hypothetical protein [Ralstonia sp. AU12-08]|uniref:hypothetical protein n=1 Tax=Ralstonia sp. AU12-08 TaxID=1235457 RepID=UPI001F24FBE9|nr:hypothetical protein [Ralstonia sp. AU12-08]